MKYEFRWLQEKVEYTPSQDYCVKDLHPGTTIPIDNPSEMAVMLPPRLQYRYSMGLVNTAEYEDPYYTELWSSWEDIPMVEEEK